MYRYKIDSSFEKIPLEINIVKAPLNDKGFADLLSINLEYTYKLNRAKNRINDYSSTVWEEVKKHTNPYEFIYAFNTKHRGNDYRSVSLYKPLSRSFFKMIEIIHEFCPHIAVAGFDKGALAEGVEGFDKGARESSCQRDEPSRGDEGLVAEALVAGFEKSRAQSNDAAFNKGARGAEALVLISVHIAEGPGGFIEAVRFVRKGKDDDHAFGMTLIDNKYNYIKGARESSVQRAEPSRGASALVPGWKQSNYFLLNNPEVHIIYGADGTGDIYNPENILFLHNEMRKVCGEDIVEDKVENNTTDSSGAQLITADGGFDFSVDYNYQEQSSCKLIFSQILGAIKCQRKGGTFVCKFFDINLFFTTEMLYLLYSLYETVYIYKPFTSRIANSEKYIICTNFQKIEPKLCESLFNVLNQWNEYTNITKETINHMFKTIPLTFVNRIKEINNEIVDAQINSINTAINIIKKQKYITNSNIYSSEMTVEKQIKYAKDWCKNYNIPYKH